MQEVFPLRSPSIERQKAFPSIGDPAFRHARQALDAIRHNRTRWEGIVSLTAASGDLAMILLGFALAFWLREQSGLIFAHVEGVPIPAISDYWKLIFFGAGAVFAGLLSKGLYGYKDLLSPAKIIGRFTVVLSICLFAFIGIGLAVQTAPPISRVFVMCSWVFIFLTVCSWRLLLSRMLQHPALVRRLRKRLVIVGAGPEIMQVKEELGTDSEMEFVGWVQGNRPNHVRELEDYNLGSLHELSYVLKRYAIDVALLTESEALQREGVSYVAKVCEREHVQFKMVPHFFEILISGLRPSVIGGVPVLGVDSLPLNAYENRTLKRIVDILGASIGLLFSFPLLMLFGALVYWESPGPIFYRQVRTGRYGQLFHIFKIRSMRMNAELDGKACWATENDSRRLKIGAFMRNWNIDEIPQFWNVLKGDMSLVGPRPERPELIEHFKFTIPHYQTRHTCRPGMSGWAQVNGLRGNTSLEERIRYDIWYVETWNIFLDFRIMLLTFFRQQNAY